MSQFSCAEPGRNEYRVYLDGSMGYPALREREKEKVKATSLGWWWEMLEKERLEFTVQEN